MDSYTSSSSKLSQTFSANVSLIQLINQSLKVVKEMLIDREYKIEYEDCKECDSKIQDTL